MAEEKKQPVTTGEKRQPVTTLGMVKVYLSNDNVKNRFNEVLGKKAPQFIASIINTVGNSKQLQECEPASIISSAMVAAALDLPIDPNLGFAALVPYNDNKTGIKYAQFQMMYKGFIQLAIRSGQYKKMNVAEVYEDELLEYNPITGELIFVSDFKETSQRKNGEKDKIIGYYAFFELNTGFRKELYMTKENCINHAKEYSASYKQDLKKGWSSSKWTTDFDAMAKKTVIKLLISKWGIMTVEMQKAILDDQKVFENEEGSYEDNPDRHIPSEHEEVVDVFASENPAEATVPES